MKTTLKNSARLALLLAAMLIGNPCFPQTQFGEIRGKLTDTASKSPVEFADVLLYQAGIRKAYALSDVFGTFYFKSIEPGTYSITVKHASFRESIMNDIVVSANKITVINFDLTSDGKVLPALLFRSSVTIKNDKGVKTIEKLPTRSLGSISSSSSSRRSGISFIGHRADATRTYIDGVDVLGSKTVPPSEIKYPEFDATELSRETRKNTMPGSPVNIKAGTLTAGEINDFSKWTLWNDLTEGELKHFASLWGILPKHRFCIQISNELKNPLSNVQVVLKNPAGEIVWRSHTDNTGKAELWANIFNTGALQKGGYRLEATHNGKTYLVKNASPFEQTINKLVIASDCFLPLNIDIVFAVDATGSMSDEISYLQAELYDVIEKVKHRNPGLNLNMGSVFYRDHGDSYLFVEQNLSPDISKVMSFIESQAAQGGGDAPEAVEAAMEVAIGKFDWRSDARARVMFLVLDAPPHQDAEVLEKIQKYTQMAAEKGIRILPIVCSGIDKAGEYLMRSIALATNGNYIFLTDDSGVGNGHISPSTDKYVVESLNVLLIRLIQQYIFMPECREKVNADSIVSVQHLANDSILTDSILDRNLVIKGDSAGNEKQEPWFLKYYPNPCPGKLQIDIKGKLSELFLADINGKLLMKIPVSRERGPQEIDLLQFPAGIYFLRYCLEGKCESGKFLLAP